MKYLHTASNSQINKLLEAKITLEQLKKEYKQPNWCKYPGALDGNMGCWSLMDLHGLRKKISCNYCKNCESFKNKLK